MQKRHHLTEAVTWPYVAHKQLRRIALKQLGVAEAEVGERSLVVEMVVWDFLWEQ